MVQLQYKLHIIWLMHTRVLKRILSGCMYSGIYQATGSSIELWNNEIWYEDSGYGTQTNFDVHIRAVAETELEVQVSTR